LLACSELGEHITRKRKRKEKKRKEKKRKEKKKTLGGGERSSPRGGGYGGT
jgi:hypothetical protein